MLHPHHQSGVGAITTKHTQHHVTKETLTICDYPMMRSPLACQVRLVFRPLACCQVRLPIGRSCSPLACQIRHPKHQKLIFLFRFHIAARSYRNGGLFQTCVRHYRNCGLCHIHAAARQMKVLRFMMPAARQAATIHHIPMPYISANFIMAKLVIIQHTFISPS